LKWPIRREIVDVFNDGRGSIQHQSIIELASISTESTVELRLQPVRLDLGASTKVDAEGVEVRLTVKLEYL